MEGAFKYFSLLTYTRLPFIAVYQHNYSKENNDD